MLDVISDDCSNIKMHSMSQIISTLLFPIELLCLAAAADTTSSWYTIVVV